MTEGSFRVRVPARRKAGPAGPADRRGAPRARVLRAHARTWTTRQLVAFGTSGHRGTPGDGTFTEAHILAITQAICDYRRGRGIDGPLFMGKDTHALSGPAQRTALEVLAANGVETIIQRDDGFTPTPSSRGRSSSTTAGGRTHLADGIVVTPSHNPPADGGFKYNPPNGGPAERT